MEVYRRFAEGKLDRLPQLAKDLVDLRTDVIIAVSPTAIKPAQDATKSIPIVMGFGKDPVRDGFVSSLAKAGGNITGVVVAPEDVLAGKRLELIKKRSRAPKLWHCSRPENPAPNCRSRKLKRWRNRIVQLAVKHRVPAVSEWPEHAEIGGMMAYGSGLAGLSSRVAWYVERILKGAKAAELPVEQPTKF